MELFTHVTALAALAVVAVQQILKLNLIPLAFANKYPVPTNILLSIVAAFIAVASETDLDVLSINQWIVLIATISVVAAITYNNTLRNWTQLRSMEGTGKE